MKRLLFHAIALLLSTIFFGRVHGQSDCGWNPDANGDNQIGVPDLLALLGVFEEEDLDEDGVWDSQDGCVGTPDTCGICNGSGPNVPVIESIESIFDSVYVEQLEEWHVFIIDSDTTFVLACPVEGCMDSLATNFNPEANLNSNLCDYGPAECGTDATITFDEYTYSLVAIGNQCWFAENLRTSQYANGDSIPIGLADIDWVATYFGATSIYAEGTDVIVETSNSNVEENLINYGRLYNWHAVNDSRGLCPSGWHVPTDSDWMVLEVELGLAQDQLHLVGARGNDEGKQMKELASATPSWNGDNSSGFTALPGGWRSIGGDYQFGLSRTYWWANSSDGPSLAWARKLDNNDRVHRRTFEPNFGFSVRCLRDEE